ncbi:MAG: YtxH domain-containing protein [Chloroflexi bacterium]|nr:YtxH domain-containing protein [Chloroflexota bacterium]
MYKFLGGLIVGLFVGWAAGILSAPQSGRDTIESISERAIELKERAVRKTEQVCEDIVLDI